jgi:hypothetical protein
VEDRAHGRAMRDVASTSAPHEQIIIVSWRCIILGQLMSDICGAKVVVVKVLDVGLDR